VTTTTTGVYHSTYRSELRLRHTNAEQIRLWLAMLAIVAAPFVLTPYWLSVANRTGLAIIGAIGLNILTGFTGQISLGQGGFLAVGAYTSGLLVVRAGFPTLVAIVCAVLFTALVGAFFGLPALRLKGLYLAIATLASQFIIIYAVRNWDLITGGQESIAVPKPELLGFVLIGDHRWYWVIAGAAVLATVTARNLFRSGLGRAFMAIRDQDIAAEALGVDLTRFKVLAFAVSSGFVGLSGALTGHYRIITWERFTLDTSIEHLAMIIVGGLGSILGSILGAIFIVLLPAVIEQLGTTLRGVFPGITRQLPALQLGAFGLVIVLFLVFEPRGLARIWQRIKDYFRLWPFRY
jgi:branched-chain amino acid transport system permease protein